MNILGLLGVLFVGLKLANIGAVASWSWWLVLLPFYGGLVFIFSLGILAGFLTKKPTYIKFKR